MAAIEVIPSANRLIRSLRDMGYDFAQAVADVVDNAIEAAATEVSVDIEFDGDNSWVRIADNGSGMKPDALREAMRFGASREYEIDDLGKFGLGLKTASLSQCQCLSLVSRWNPDRADIAGYSWDLDHIQKTNRWEILPIERNALTASLREPLRDAPGTVVMWRRLDRLLGYKHPYGEAARKRLLQMCRDAEVHLGMVFHRFLAGEVPHKNLKLFVNGNRVAAWDPYCRGETKTKVLQPVVIPLEYEGARGEIHLDPYVLPPQDGFAARAGADAAAGPAGWNQQQGFYIYRSERMIQSGGWSNLRAPDEHTKLARISVRFTPALDEAFKINVAKMRVQLPSATRDAIREAIVPVVKLAREVYDRKPSGAPSTPTRIPQASGSPTTAGSPASGAGTVPSCVAEGDKGPVPNGILSGTPSPSTYSDRSLLAFDDWVRLMRAAATDDERPIVDAVLARMQAADRKAR